MNELAHIELRGIGKRYGGVQALQNIDLTIDRGSVHGLVGENGAGKSTLGKIIGGLISPDNGTIRVAGKRVVYRSPRQALADGITVISQEISLVPARSVIENVFLGSEVSRFGFVDARAQKLRFGKLADRVGFALPPDIPVASLRLADQQKAEILRAVARDVRLIVMDEPTTALPGTDAQKLYAIVRRLRQAGITIVYVSHFLSEILALVDQVTVLRGGRVVRTAKATDESPKSLVTAMLGRPLELTFPEKRPPPSDSPKVLDAVGLNRGRHVLDVSFSLRAGEIVGLAGLVGSGRSETARLVFGADKADSGEVYFNGTKARVQSPRHAVRHGVGMVPESRKEQGLVMAQSVTQNVSITDLKQVSHRGIVIGPTEVTVVGRMLQKVDVRGARMTAAVSTLSGGNQQKVVFAKWLFPSPSVLIADEPTRGVDVGAKRAIYELIVSIAAQGVAVLLISSDLEEVLGLAHRVLVMRTGRIVAEFSEGATEQEILAVALEVDVEGPSAAPQ